MPRLVLLVKDQLLMDTVEYWVICRPDLGIKVDRVTAQNWRAKIAPRQNVRRSYCVNHTVDFTKAKIRTLADSLLGLIPFPTPDMSMIFEPFSFDRLCCVWT